MLPAFPSGIPVFKASPFIAGLTMLLPIVGAHLHHYQSQNEQMTNKSRGEAEPVLPKSTLTLVWKEGPLRSALSSTPGTFKRLSS
jgi:hypothetical protein